MTTGQENMKKNSEILGLHVPCSQAGVFQGAFLQRKVAGLSGQPIIRLDHGHPSNKLVLMTLC